MKLETVSPGFRNAQWQDVLYLPKSGLYTLGRGSLDGRDRHNYLYFIDVIYQMFLPLLQ
jgi:hypothetical protein